MKITLRKPPRVFHLALAMIGMLALPSWAGEGLAAAQLSFFKFRWRGEIKEAHTHALNVLHAAGYRIPGGQEETANVSYGTLPKGSTEPKLMAHILCSTVKSEAEFQTEVVIIAAGNDISFAEAECGKLHDLMRHAGGTDREMPDTILKGKRQTSPAPGNDALVYAQDIWSTYKGAREAAAAAGHRILDEMEFKPDAVDPAKPPSVQTGTNQEGGLTAGIVATEDHINSQIQMHFYAAACYQVPPNGPQDQALKAMHQAKDIVHHYLIDMTHIKDLDPGNGNPMSHPK